MEEKKFKSNGGGYLLRPLFIEYNFTDEMKVYCLYTLKDSEYEGYPSLYCLYMKSVEEDPLEYHFATTYLGGWEHWERLQECSWFKPYISKWRREADVRLKAKALRRIMSEAKTNSRDALAASKYLIERGWEPKIKSTRGRPSKEEIKQELDKQVEFEKTLEDEAKRIGLVN